MIATGWHLLCILNVIRTSCVNRSNLNVDSLCTCLVVGSAVCPITWNKWDDSKQIESRSTDYRWRSSGMFNHPVFSLRSLYAVPRICSAIPFLSFQLRLKWSHGLRQDLEDSVSIQTSPHSSFDSLEVKTGWKHNTWLPRCMFSKLKRCATAQWSLTRAKKQTY